jgi:UDP-N-acetylglucosamine--N-acetylmuramyl-(pentapeptide) pyrophosphoryl-undecaprenol N-acetylglucosamine transferase
MKGKKTLKKAKTAPPKNTKPTLLIAAGGTGGHITPGISIAEAWLAAGGRIVFATLIKNLDYPDIARMAPDERVSIVAYDAPRLPKNPLKLWDFLRRFRASYRLVAQAAAAEQVAAVIGMGGYSSFPAVFFAILKRVPLFLCEQNARWGIVTRVGKRFARRIFLAFAADAKLTAKFVVTGNPIRAMFTQSGKKPGMPKKPHLLFIGGSQGAGDLNRLYLEFSGRAEAKGVHCTVAAGNAAFTDIQARARKGDDILPFIQDMPAAYGAATAVVARCGSGTLFELLWSGKPAFLIPYPFATANHQKANALALAQKMPCAIYDQRPFDTRRAADELVSFMRNPPQAKSAVADAPAEQQIIRYLEEDLTHASHQPIH